MGPLTDEPIHLPQTGPVVCAGTADPMPGPDAGQRERFGAAALPLQDGLYRFAVRLTRNEDDAEDLVQEAFLRAYRSCHQVRPGTSFRAWIFRILTNAFIDQYRRRAREPETVSYEAGEDLYLYSRLTESDSDGFGNPETLVLQKLQCEGILAAIDRLPNDYRVVITLSDIEGLSYKEIAEIVGCPVGTVGSRLNRARHTLQRVLCGHLQDAA